MARFPPQTPSQLNEEQKKTYEVFNDIAENAFGKTYVWERRLRAAVDQCLDS
jgi:hypothetical protein